MPATPTKRMIRITLDLMCYDDLDLESLDWRNILALEGDEDLHINIEDFSDIY